MSKQFASHLEKHLAKQGVQVKAKFIAGDEETRDDEIVLSDKEGNRLPVHVQLGSDYMLVGVYEYDADGEISGVRPGRPLSREHGLRALVQETANKIVEHQTDTNSSLPSLK
jgi:hypothetical protein